MAGLAAAPGPGGLALWTARRGVCIHASLQTADGGDLVPRPNSDGEGAGSPVHDSVGAVEGVLERGDNVAPAYCSQMKGTQRRLGGISSGSSYSNYAC